MKIYDENQDRSKQVSVRIPEWLWERLEGLIVEEGGNRSKHIIQAVENYVEAYKAIQGGSNGN